MPRVLYIKVEIETGENGGGHQPLLEFNGHCLGFENASGGTESGDRFEGDFAPNSVAHSVRLVGPETGEWDLASLKVTYGVPGQDRYDVKFAPVKLDEETSLDIWQPPQPPTFDV